MLGEEVRNGLRLVNGSVVHDHRDFSLQMTAQRVVDDRDRSARYGSAASRRSSICCRVNRFGRQTSDIPAVYTSPATYPVINWSQAHARNETEPTLDFIFK